MLSALPRRHAHLSQLGRHIWVFDPFRAVGDLFVVEYQSCCFPRQYCFIKRDSLWEGEGVLFHGFNDHVLRVGSLDGRS